MAKTKPKIEIPSAPKHARQVQRIRAQAAKRGINLGYTETKKRYTASTKLGQARIKASKAKRPSPKSPFAGQPKPVPLTTPGPARARSFVTQAPPGASSRARVKHAGRSLFHGQKAQRPAAPKPPPAPKAPSKLGARVKAAAGKMKPRTFEKPERKPGVGRVGRAVRTVGRETMPFAGAGAKPSRVLPTKFSKPVGALRWAGRGAGGLGAIGGQVAAAAAAGKGAKQIAKEAGTGVAISGTLGVVAPRLVTRVAAPIGAAQGIYDIGRATKAAYKGVKAAREVAPHARAAKKAGFKVTRRAPWKGLLTGKADIKVRETAKTRAATKAYEARARKEARRGR
jgi:hypothetical protein